jgi:RecA/RadA recombinase
MDVASVATAMLNAAKDAAGQTWPQIQHDFASDLGAVLRNAAKIETQLAAGELTPDEAKDLLEDQSNTLFMLTAEVEQASKIATQNAINAAIDALWLAIRAAIP